MCFNKTLFTFFAGIFTTMGLLAIGIPLAILFKIFGALFLVAFTIGVVLFAIIYFVYGD